MGRHYSNAVRRSDRTVGPKAWAKARALGFFALAQGAAWAGFKNAVTLSSGRKTLENGTVYIVNKDITVKAGAGFSAYAVNANSTAVLYIPAGKTLTLKGGAGSEETGAVGEAGISLPAGATLIVTGGGTLDVTGGKAANGSTGGNWRCNSSWGDKADVGYNNLDSTGGGNGGSAGGGNGSVSYRAAASSKRDSRGGYGGAGSFRGGAAAGGRRERDHRGAVGRTAAEQVLQGKGKMTAGILQ